MLLLPTASHAVLAPTPPRRSVALPFLSAPRALDGTLVGDYGFDPLSIATPETLPRMRAAELRHGRLAMVATWGWPVAEGGLALAQRAVPVASVCSGVGCAVDSTEAGREAALQLAQIGVASNLYWGALFVMACAGELRARSLEGSVQARDSRDHGLHS